jgi:RNA polymerase sigma-70 factor (ECF subfamily)
MQTTSTCPDREFQQRLQERDPAALAKFFDTWFPQIHSFVRRQVHDEHTAEDLTQDIFFNIHRAIDSYDPERKLEPWIFRIASNKIRDHWRASHRRHFNPVDEENVSLTETLALSEQLPDQPLQETEASTALRSAIDKLPKNLRETVIMRAYEGASFEAIGEALGRNSTAVRKRYSRALHALRELVDPSQFNLGELV